ncbi:MAG: hypothetical protein AB7P99_03435 [Vicinamibacterales bacterium]
MFVNRLLARRRLTAWLALGALLALTLVREIPPPTGDRLGLRRFVTPEITGCDPDKRFGCTFASQSFVMNADGLRAVEFMPVAVAASPRGRLTLRLVDLAALQVIRSQEVAAAELAAAGVFRFAFEPVADSRDGRYRFDIVATDDARGIAVRATRGEGYAAGSMLWNDRPRWADLAFNADAGSRPAWRALWSYRKAPGAWSNGALALTALAGAWALLLAVLGTTARLGGVE